MTTSARHPRPPRPPLAQVLDPKVDEARIRSVWRGVEPALIESERGAGRGRRSARGVALGASLALIALVALALTRGPSVEPVGFLALADGGAPAAFAAEAGDEVMTFADQSRIELSAGAEIVPTLNDVREFALTLTRGSIRVAVTPGGPRRWRLDCGLATVEVVGTEFRIDRGDDGVRVRVERGHVRVTAEDGRSWDLLAGDQVWVEPPVVAVEAAEPAAEAPPPPAPLVAEPPVAEVVAIAPRAVRVEARPSAVAPPPRWTDLAESGAYDRAYEALRDARGTGGEIARADPRELMLLADVARLSGHPAEAVEPLERLISSHASAPETRLAAVVLGRIEQDALHAPREAARAFERAEQIGVPASLAADVEGRLALAYLDLDDPRGAVRARRYLDEHPTGPLASTLAARIE